MKEKLIDTLENIGIYEVTMHAELIAEALIENGATVRAKGEWEKTSKTMPIYGCSICGERNLFKNGNNVFSNFCPNCGSDMRGDKSEID